MNTKNLFRMAALAFVGSCMVACSGSDEITTEPTPQSPTPNDGVVKLRCEVCINGGSGTRAVDATGKTSWTVGERVGVCYENTSLELVTSTDGTVVDIKPAKTENEKDTAVIEATLLRPGDGRKAYIITPFSQWNDDLTFHTIHLFNNQKGTLADVSENWDFAISDEATLWVSGNSIYARLNYDPQTKVSTPVVMRNQNCIWKLTLQDTNGSPINATELKINDGFNDYTISNNNQPASEFYVALLPREHKNFTFTAKASNGRLFTKRNNITLSDCTSANVGDVFDKDGNVYSVSTASGILYSASFNDVTIESSKFYTSTLTLDVDNDFTPVAMIAYVGEAGEADTSDGASAYKGLAIALDVENVAWTSWGTNANGSCTSPISENFTDYKGDSDLNGIYKTGRLASGACGHSDHNAAKSATGYSVTGFTPSSIGCSNWFLPTCGQLIKIHEACGEPVSQWIAWGYCPDKIDGLKTKLLAAGATYAFKAPNNPGQYTIWTCSERIRTFKSGGQTKTNYVPIYDVDGSLGWLTEDASHGSYARPVLAF